MARRKKNTTDDAGSTPKRAKRTKLIVKKFLKDKGHDATTVDAEVTGVPVHVALCNLLGISHDEYLAIGGTLE